MNKMADVLGRAGAWCGQNKYLSAIKNAFQNFMPLTIAGAIGVLWCNVLVNDQTGLGLFFKPIMALDFLNPAFQAVQLLYNQLYHSWYHSWYRPRNRCLEHGS